MVALRLLALATGIGILLHGQSTQGLIAGHVRDGQTSQAIPNAIVSFENLATNTRGVTHTSESGAFNAPLLPPGTYRLTVEMAGYQSRAIYRLELPVAGFLNIDFDLRPLGSLLESSPSKTIILGNQSVLSYFGPDLDPAYTGTFDPEPSSTEQLEPSISTVIDPQMIADLPLTGRDVYTALVLVPGVTADAATARGLGLSANGQRPTSSDFLLDGVEDNNHLISGPAFSIPPETVQEYRVSTSNFSAEHGRTSGQVANVVTRSGESAWHALLYSDLKNDVLNANSFQINLQGFPRAPLKQVRVGATAGGPLLSKRLFTFTGLEYFHSSSLASPTSYVLPSQSFADSLPLDTVAGALLRSHPPAQWGTGDTGAITLLHPTVKFQRLTGIERLDYEPSSRHHVLARVAAQELTRPDFVWTPYGNANSGAGDVATALTAVSAWSSQTTTEVRTGFSEDSLSWGNPLPNVPNLAILGVPISLPGAASGFALSDHASTFELAGNALYIAGRSFLKAGGGMVYRSTGLHLYRKPTFFFADVDAFKNDAPYLLIGPVSRTQHSSGVNAVPNGGGRYNYGQYVGFVQEDFRWTRRLSVNAGVRVDAFAAPRSQGPAPDLLVDLGPGTTVPAQIQTATLATRLHSPLFAADTANWAVRLGAAYAIGDGRTVLRGGCGMFYDDWFDNIWTSSIFNELGKGSGQLSGSTNYLEPLNSLYSHLPTLSLDHFYNLTAFAKRLATPRVYSYFLGLQRAISQNWTIDVDGVGSAGRLLLTNDVVNRQNPTINYLRPNKMISEDINYRANEGYSNYSALVVSTRYSRHRTLLNLSYSWSHTIDNQSDPLLGDFFDLGFSNQVDRAFGSNYFASFSREFDKESDRGNADFDQRHNIVAIASWHGPSFHSNRILPRLLRDWTASGLYALRSGLHYTIYYGGNCVPICNTRPNLIAPDPLLSDPLPVTGGELVLAKGAFARPPLIENGSLGRNTFHGNWFQNLDVSIAREFPIPRFGETARFTARADFFNLLNHANFNNPDGFINADDFGVALKGRIARTGFPALTPLNETARQIELLVRLQF